MLAVGVAGDVVVVSLVTEGGTLGEADETGGDSVKEGVDDVFAIVDVDNDGTKPEDAVAKEIGVKQGNSSFVKAESAARTSHQRARS